MRFPLITFCFIFSPFAISTWRTTWRRVGITAGRTGGWVVWNLMTAQATLWLAAIASRPCALLSGLIKRATPCLYCGWTLLFVFITTFYACFLIVLTPPGADWTYWARARRTAICQARQPASSLAVCWYSRFACGFWKGGQRRVNGHLSRVTVGEVPITQPSRMLDTCRCSAWLS